MLITLCTFCESSTLIVNALPETGFSLFGALGWSSGLVELRVCGLWPLFSAVDWPDRWLRSYRKGIALCSSSSPPASECPVLIGVLASAFLLSILYVEDCLSIWSMLSYCWWSSIDGV